jgi:hypothetical protein
MCAKTSFFSNFDRDAVIDVSYIHFWFKMKIMVVKISRKRIDQGIISFVAKIYNDSWFF